METFSILKAKIFSDIESVENLLIDEDIGRAKTSHEKPRELPADDEEGHFGGIDDDFEIPCTAATNDPFFSQNGGQFIPATLTQNPNEMDMIAENPVYDMNGMERFDGSNLIEAPLQVNVLNIEYAKTSKNIDVRRLKQVIWQLLCDTNNQQNEQDKVIYPKIV